MSELRALVHRASMFQHFSINNLRSADVTKFLETGLRKASKDLVFSTTTGQNNFVESGGSKYLISEQWIVGVNSQWDNGFGETGSFGYTAGTNKMKGVSPSVFKKTKWKKYIKNSLKRDNYVSITNSSNFKIDTGSGNDFLKLARLSTDLIKSGAGDDAVEIRNEVFARIQLGKGQDVVTGIGYGGAVIVEDYSFKEDIIKSEAKIEWFKRPSDSSIVLMKAPNFDVDFGLSTLSSGYLVLEGITGIDKINFDGKPHLIEVEV